MTGRSEPLMCQALQLIFFVEDFSAICPVAIEAGAGFGAFLDVIENVSVEFAVSVQAHTCKFLVKVVITGSILGFFLYFAHALIQRP